MSDKRRGLGRGLGALIPSATPAARTTGDRPVDVFFPGREEGGTVTTLPAPTVSTETVADPSTAGSGHDGSAGGASNGSGTDDGRSFTTELNGIELVPVPGARFAEIPVDQIVPNSKQPRQVFDEEALAELVHSVREIGVLQPIVVRAIAAPSVVAPSVDAPSVDAPSVDVDGAAPRFELIMGERRWRAATQAGLEVVPAIIRDTSDDDMLRDALLENLHRSELNPLEEAAAYQQLLDDFGCTHDELATRIGRSRPQISNTIRLLKLPPQVQRRVAAGVLSAGHARALLGLEDPAAMDALALRIVAEGLSVRAVEEIVALGDGKPQKPRAKKPRPGGRQVELNDLATRLGDRLDTRVTIALGRTKGKLSVEFASVDDLNRILALISPQERKAFGLSSTE